ncbi:MAG: energy transducer TonB [Candidatus Kapabacteria bacterium]|nr:energy transducer TonB [Candidatus Kapabacteria bacterium]
MKTILKFSFLLKFLLILALFVSNANSMYKSEQKEFKSKNKDSVQNIHESKAKAIDSNKKLIKPNSEIEPDSTQFINVEREPQMDWERLSKLVVYPDQARNSNIEGKVVLRLLISKDGSIKKRIVEESNSKLLTDAAIQAIDSYGKLVPAMNHNQPVAVWMIVPITFKLRN